MTERILFNQTSIWAVLANLLSTTLLLSINLLLPRILWQILPLQPLPEGNPSKSCSPAFSPVACQQHHTYPSTGPHPSAQGCGSQVLACIRYWGPGARDGGWGWGRGRGRGGRLLKHRLLVQPQEFLIQEVWAKTQPMAFLTGPQVMLAVIWGTSCLNQKPIPTKSLLNFHTS